jgi:hypothetical protein
MSNVEKFGDFLQQKIDKYLEIVNTPFNINYVNNKNRLIGDFTINEKKYIIIYQTYYNNIITVKFYKQDLSGDWDTNIIDRDNQNVGQAGRVLSTVKESIFGYIKENKPNCLLFGALDASKDRKNLYNHFCNDIIFKFNEYKFEKGYINNETFFIVYNDLFDKSIINNNLIEEIRLNELNDTEF